MRKRTWDGHNINYRIPAPMAEILDQIVGENAGIHDIKSRRDLIIRILSQFIINYCPEDKYAQALKTLTFTN
jgi:hypothetical protein